MNLIDTLRAIGTATKESATEYDGPFSYAGEVHASLVGFLVGFVAATTGRWELLVPFAAVVVLEQYRAGTKGLSEFRREPWYGAGGVLTGIFLGATALVVVTGVGEWKQDPENPSE